MSIIYINPYRFAAVSYDADAQTYITAVETADGQALEVGVKNAINSFVVGCKTDGTWSAITGACVLAGARTVAGALIPLKGTSPTNYNFTSSDYNRKTGFKGDGVTKYLDSNINNNSLPNLSKGTWFFVSQIDGGATFIGWRSGSQWNSYVSTNLIAGIGAVDWPVSITAPTFAGCQVNQSVMQSRCNNLTNTVAHTSGGNNTSITWTVFERNQSSFKGKHRLSFYCIASALDPALLDARVTDLMTAIGAAIP